MSDAVPPTEPAKTPRRFFWPRGLSARLLLLTVLMVALGNLLILPPNLAAFEEQRLLDRLRAAEVATLVTASAPNGVVSAKLAQQLLDSAGVVQVSLGVDHERHLILQMPRLSEPPYLVDLRGRGPLSWIAPFETLFGAPGRMVRVMAKPRFLHGDFVEIVAPDAPLKKEILAQLSRLIALGVFTSLLAGAAVYLALNALLVRPMQRITLSMERFRADPADPLATIIPSGRRDEIGRAERELDRMQADLRAALNSRARLAALGEAVAKINHDLRNMLTSAKLASERLSTSADPKVAQALPRLERALDRAVTLASNVLTFGKSDEPPPQVLRLPVAAALEAAAEDAGLQAGRVELLTHLEPDLEAQADPDQLHRILVNLLRNAREAIDGEPGLGRRGVIVADGWQAEGHTVLRLTDNGPGLPERARANLFLPFAGSTRSGGAGLGLAIARELAQAHGGELSLVSSGPEGAVFELRLPRSA
jgi:signal transduction histidine kinase